MPVVKQARYQFSVHQAAEYGLAVQWYNHSLAMLPDHDSSNKNLAKLHVSVLL